ncbi:hydrogen peroxide-dependent heme synthase [Sanguibacter sp. HDW7]|uniref:hydrogen peroxide-dependent heme synthase n=1 Tax=Sanguibacter sp. HDW7 TaxID=2714931 RepID=UPI00140AF2D7|nr:hydrogen peroxide-dependent heme synthase [Sanguibacter sp. HDW7]QIK84615.1 chlorite dismutase family protein [Sanguibacter sp. HDW7]
MSNDAYGAPTSTNDGPEPVAYTLWAVLRRDPAAEPLLTRLLGDEVDASATSVPQDTVVTLLEAASDDLGALVDDLPEGVDLRGLYDASGLRADADVIVWLTGPTAEGLQAALRTLRTSVLLGDLLPTWNALGVHRPAEFTARHLPAFMRGTEPKDWLTVYPFVRSYDWYLLPEDERRAMLADHGIKGREFPQVLSNTVSAFSLGDYEWLLGLEADELTDLVDLMRHLRYTEARRHVRDELPFYTGRNVSIERLAAILLDVA